MFMIRGQKQWFSKYQSSNLPVTNNRNHRAIPYCNRGSKIQMHSSENENHDPSLGLIFDCDGTLADTMPLHFLAWRNTMRRHGIEFNEDRFYSMAGQPTVRIIRTLLGEQNLPGNAEEIAEEKEQAFLEVLPQVKPVDPIVEIARKYRDTNAMGVGSGSNRDVVLLVLKHIGLADFFDAVVGAEETKYHKPEPDVFLEVARRIQVPARQCCVYEDADLGIEAARRAGMTWFDVRSVHTPQRIT